MSGQTSNKPLFSQHYLEHRLPDSPEWQEDVSVAFSRLESLYQQKKAILPTLNEAQTEAELIQPILEILGFSYIPQVSSRGKGRSERPDYALFARENDRYQAYSLQNNETAFYSQVLAIAEAKYWQRSLSDVSKNDQRDIWKNSNPSFQITNYLTGTGVDWGILTNGREWRLYYRQASSTATEFYLVDLMELLEGGDRQKFRYFWLFFRQEAFIKDIHGQNFLERIREGSTTYATRVGNELKELVFDRIFPDISKGFVSLNTDIQPDLLYEASLSLLYKLLFLLYAEARDLLPVRGDYRDYSLLQKTREIAIKIDRQQVFSRTSTGIYDALLSLFRIVDRGDANLAVPRYNGGLFDMEEGRVNCFLGQYKLSDAVLAPILDKLARFEGQPIDYSFLGVRQLGSIYEGLLEYRIVIEGESVHLENDRGERKATGSYYTPDYIVKYIVSHTLKPILEQRAQQFGDVMTEIATRRQESSDRRLGNLSQQGLQKELQRLEKKAITTLLDLKLCDPAMGSGHFLVEAVDYLTDELIQILNLYPEDNPVLTMLETTRQNIIDNLRQQGIILDSPTLEPTQLLQRVVMKRCIYGVDINPMAVELAKVSLWLHSFTVGAPLSFLDHHLRCGNSLIGTTAKAAEAAMIEEESGQLTLLTGPFVGLLRAAEIMRGISTLSDATFAEVEASEQLFRDFDSQAKPYKRLLDVFLSRFFGVKTAIEFLQRYGGNISAINWDKLPRSDQGILDQAASLYKSKCFFHWDLEFPEVFIDLDSASWKDNPGFDAVIGNPPYVRQEGLKEIKPFLKENYQSFHGVADLYVYFVEMGLLSLQQGGHLGLIISNKFMRANYGTKLRQFLTQQTTIKEIIDFGELPVFSEAATFPSILLIENNTVAQQNVLVSKIKSLKFNSLIDVINDLSYYVCENSLSVEGWSLAKNQIAKIINKLNKDNISLAQYIQLQIFYGIKTGCNEAFFIDQYTRSKLIESDPKSAEIIKPLVVGDDIRKYEINYQEIFLIFTRRGININEYPSIKKHLEKFKNKLEPKPELHSGTWQGRKPGNYKWYEIQDTVDYWTFFEHPKIIYPVIASSSRFMLDNQGYFPNDKCFIIPCSDFYLLALLNSKLLFNVTKLMVSVLGDEDAGGRLELRSIHLQNIPIRKISFSTNSDRRQHCLEKLIKSYQEKQEILKEIEEHIRREETDIVHDILSYLAEQMIEINGEKQKEIKSFLRYLERIIGSAIDNLTNKSKIQNYLGDYQKSEPHLSLDQLWEILKKNKKKISVNLLDRQIQETLEKEYQTSLDKLLPLKQQLSTTDELIDLIVYKLYGLSEEEIKIIEGRE
ncbi:MAG: restriction endonuclease [Microcystis panniformis Mp_MB_F_20051200_S9]|uniref:site-specific DNA-methyltransferase (adenine-specific) n=1 Tax=Microcystis panniformis Mp_MB_F_20051200_S9 TaxID=2486223 RepID=A0A552Q8K7_9CHRO|nr:MAG: restriction endonuclease [Microcystis panniformis Mp_MB_F_20080800_S26D]TRV45956.1 MAG: restriction endonuclease [Microcystis panniformis Mp_GB_SS_20050300_S99D]TRV46707.1 MAG: restriction endonuclease [Microcystis panniformis Mp_GB_SS_20050300_S99]TRV58558.1 MAG: restriction endonuclease [Microcystis panniformis Mp_MB_F_20080800_S26]TRV63866.1 MAG: restriction endonuclease [Microcystis panniformis Mp_MB_F_20051200_S9D]TRV65558.1 MAG: restriction endonuclease [Microcystis panniformis M